MRSFWIALALLTSVACARPEPPAPVATTPLAPKAAPRESTTQKSAPTAVVVPAPPVVKASPGRVACGSTSCDTTHQVCCNGARCIEHADVQAWVKAHPNKARYHRLMGDGCPMAGEWSNEAAACDDAGDCSDGKACCEQGRGSEYWAFACEASPCEQVCSGPGSCTPGYHCEYDKNATGAVRGKCRFTAAKVSCGTQTCGGDKPFCCEPTQSDIDEEPPILPHCRAAAESCEGSSRRLECRQNTDCGDNRKCCGLNRGETLCLASCTVRLGDRPTCKRLTDCPKDAELVPKSCAGTGIKYCEY